MLREQMGSPIELRAERAAFLFADALPYNLSAVPESIGIAGLSRAVTRSGKPRKEHEAHKTQIPEIVTRILTDHDNNAQRTENDQAIFGFANEAAQESVTDVVVRVFQTWEMCQAKRKQKYLLDGTPEAYWLVIETTAAVMDCMTPNSGFNIIDNKKDRETLTRLVAFRGPDFARKWFDGAIFDEWASDEDVLLSEYTAWQKTLTPSAYKEILYSNINTPLNVFRAMQRNLRAHLSDKKLAAYFGWTTQEVQKFFTSSVRHTIARKHIRDASEALRSIRNSLEYDLTDDVIAKHSGLDAATVRTVLPLSTRKYLAVRNTANPIAAAVQIVQHIAKTLSVSNIAKQTGQPPSFVEEAFPPTILSAFAKSYPHNPLAAVKAWVDGIISLNDQKDRYMRQLRDKHAHR